MIETITAWFNAALAWAEKMPPEGWAILMGLLIGGAATQWLKRTFPVQVFFPGKSSKFYSTIIRLVAFVCAFIPTYALMPDNEYEIHVAFAVGFACPSFYKGLSFFLYKKWPAMEKRISGTGDSK